ncbi:hypothetical protein F5Y19DRAFT_484706 [Xylariaceae sp. FL1651]|nr:hypothetical protein F5Y19DRAFT_484706 [Xylariaceae sp. FL1651]
MPIPFRIPVPLRSGGSHGVEAHPILALRQQGGLPPRNSKRDDTGNPPTLIIVVVLVVIAIIFTVAGFLVLKRRSQLRRKYQRAGNLDPDSSTTSNSNRRVGPGRLNAVSEANRNSTATTVDRNTSVRSIMTLPKYTNMANEGEQVLGREGERDGVDVILELPTAEQHEALRDQEMQTMFQIREVRRQQNADREERRRLTQEARARGDLVALDELRLRRQAESNNSNTVIEDLRETQGQIRTRRERAVSSVSYHDLGVARHDGSRIRANSTESDRVGLLSGAASIDQSTRSPSALSNRRVSDVGSIAPPSLYSRSPSAQSHHRLHSVSSVMSLDENGEVEPRSGAATPRLGSSYHTQAGSSPEIVTEADLHDGDMPPPDYEDVSLEDARSGATTPMMFHDSPPDYVDHGHRNSESESGDLASPSDGDWSRRSSNRSSRGVGGVPQLPSLRIRELPQIVIEPSTTHPSERGR